MAGGGYVKIFRSVYDCPAFRDAIEASCFVWMISRAAWRPVSVRYRGLRLELDRGELAISTRDLAATFGWSEVKSRRFLSRLQSDAMIDARTDAGVTIIRLSNYDAFQGSVEPDDAPTDALGSAEVTQHRRSADAQNKESNAPNESNAGGAGSGDRPQSRFPAPGAPDVDAAFDMWNRFCVEHGRDPAARLTEQRRRDLNSRLSEVGGIDGWPTVLERIDASDWASGRQGNPPLHLDQLLTESVFTRLMEGAYAATFKRGNGFSQLRPSVIEAGAEVMARLNRGEPAFKWDESDIPY